MSNHDACLSRLRTRFSGLVPVGNVESVYLRPIIEAALLITHAEGEVDPESRLVARASAANLRQLLRQRSGLVAEPLVSTSELRRILLGAIAG